MRLFDKLLTGRIYKCTQVHLIMAGVSWDPECTQNRSSSLVLSYNRLKIGLLGTFLPPVNGTQSDLIDVVSQDLPRPINSRFSDLVFLDSFYLFEGNKVLKSLSNWLIFGTPRTL